MFGKQTTRDAVLALAVAMVGGVAVSQPASGAVITWNSATTGGSWETPTAWSSGVLPAAADTAALNDVTSGTRTLTVDQAESITQLTMTQATAGAVNKLQLNNTLNLGATPLVLTPTAGVGSIVLDLNGQMLTSSAGTSGHNAVNLDGTTSMVGSGSVLKLVNTNAQGGMTVSNAGNLTMDGSSMVWQWDATSNNNAAPGKSRSFINSGSWTMQNGASISFISTTGRVTGGFGILQGNSNAGTLNLLSGSVVASQGLTNTGTLQLGEGVVLGGTPTNALGTITLNNNGGTVNVTGSARFGEDTERTSGTDTITNGASGTGANFNIGNGANTPTLTLQGYNVAWANNAGNTTTVAGGAALKLMALSAADGNSFINHTTQITNAGTFALAGKLQLQPNHAGVVSNQTNNSITNTGVLAVTGNSAVLERLANTRSGAYVVADATHVGNNTIIYNNAGGVLRGSSARDTLTYTNSTGNTAAMSALTIANAGGAVSPGNGSGGSALTSVGALTLTNANLNFDATTGGLLTMDIGGNAASGNFDTLALNAGSGVTGVGALSLSGSSDVLNLTTVNGYDPTNSGETYTLARYVSHSGGFDTLQLNGVATSSYSVDYTPTAMTVTFAAVPEPTAMALLGVAACGLLGGRRRRA